jgi:SAM-dependent methyltransferase
MAFAARAGRALSRSLSFDRIADTYDATRGGFPVGRLFADAIAAHLPDAGARIVELGVGTGLVALPLTERGHTVLGVDLSTKMMAIARDRIGARVVLGDATRTPIATASCDSVVAARVLHVVADPAAVLTEAARIVRAGCPIVVILAGASRLDPRDDIDDATAAMRTGPLRGPDADATVALASVVGSLELVALDRTEPIEYAESPREHAEKVRGRTWSGFWEIDNATWARTADVAIEQLLALPEPDRARRRLRSNRVLVFTRR